MTPGHVLELRSASAAQTQAIAATIAASAEPGDVVVLAGELGAGKTAFVQGFGAALGVTAPITSPTFTIVQEYDGRVPVHHVDAYRLERVHEVAELALPELLDDGGIVLIEWGDVVATALPSDFLELTMQFGPADDDRELTLRPVGPRWAARWGRLCEGLAEVAELGERDDGQDGTGPGSAEDGKAR